MPEGICMLLRGSSTLLIMLAFSFASRPAFCLETPPQPGGSAGDVATGDVPEPPKPSSGSNWEKDPSAWKVSIYPIYAWLPIFGGNISVPSPPRPSNPIQTPSTSSVSGNFNGAGFAGFEVEKSRVIVRGTFLYASISGDHTDPKAHVGLDILFGELMGGYEIVKDLSLEGGVRRMNVKITASVDPNPEVSRKPGIWDPLIGITWKHQLGRKWLFRTHFDGGGFGVGSDVTYSGTARVDYRFVKHFGVTMGFSALHFKITDSATDSTGVVRNLEAKQTLYGPLLGLGIYF